MTSGEIGNGGQWEEAFTLGMSPHGGVEEALPQPPQPVQEFLRPTAETDGDQLYEDGEESHIIEAVDVFFDEIQPDVELSYAAWQQVKEAQAVTADFQNDPELNAARDRNIRIEGIPKDPQRKVMSTVPTPGSRAIRRYHERHSYRHAQILLSTAYTESENYVKANIDNLFSGETEEEQRANAAKVVADGIESFGAAADEAFTGQVPDILLRTSKSLYEAYGKAHAADFRILGKANMLLDGPPEVAHAFLDRIKEMAESAAKGIVELPGLLETLAANHAHYPDDGLLATHIKRIAGQPDDFAVEFLNRFLDTPDGITKEDLKATANRREVAVVMGFMQLSESIIGAQTDLSPQDYRQAFANLWRSWPEPVKAALEKYTDNNLISYRQSVSSALKPFIRQGRLPVTGKQIAFDDNRIKDVTHAKKVKKSASVITVANKAQDMGDVLGTPERQPLARLAYLVSTGHSVRKNIFRLEELEDVEALLEVKHFKNFLDMHPENGFLDTVRSAVAKLIEDPFNPVSTKPWRGLHYHLDDDPDRRFRRFRRFSFKGFPGVSKDSMAPKTRLVYSVLPDVEVVDPDTEIAQVVPTLGIYGIFLKQGIESTPMLPRRR